MNIQRKIASKIMKCGLKRVWIDPKRLDDVSNAITKKDVKALIKDGVIKKIPEAGISSGRRAVVLKQKKKGRRSGIGRRKGPSQKRKTVWIKRIRAIRRYLNKFREEEKITSASYRDAYNKSKSGYFKDKAHVKMYLEKNSLLIRKEKK